MQARRALVADLPGIVLDTNVALDWLAFRDPRVRGVAQAILQHHVGWLSCPQMRSELLHMLAHRSLAHCAPDTTRARALLDAHARLLTDPVATAQPPRPVCTDADDQIFVDLALEHRARWLLTRDKALLKLARKLATRGLQVMEPGQWPGQ
jgi:predicted nucleic acid-binding protein